MADDAGENADYVELRNPGPQKRSLHTLELAENLFGGSGRLKFSDALLAAYPNDDVSLATGRHRLIFCDEDGFARRCFTLPSNSTPTPVAISIFFNGQRPAHRRSSIPSPFRRSLRTWPTPASVWADDSSACLRRREPRTSDPARSCRCSSRQADAAAFVLAIPTQNGRQVGLETSESLQTGLWSLVLPGTIGDGFERLLEQPVAGLHQFYRLRE